MLDMTRTCPKNLELYQVTKFDMSYQKNTIEEVDLTIGVLEVLCSLEVPSFTFV